MPSTPHMNGVIYQKQQDHFEKIAPKIVAVSARNVGELVYSLLPLDDTGLHLLDGSVLYGNGPYGSFVDYVQGLYNSGQYDNLFVTEVEWQQSVSDYEVCGKFVVDTTNDTVRLPKVTGFMEATVNLDAVGELVEAGLPNITGGFGSTGNAPTGAFTSVSSSNVFSSGSDRTRYETSFDASLSNAIYKDNFNKVQPQSIKGFIYMVLANKVRNPMNFDVSQAVRGAAVPVGTIIMSANTTVPQGYLLCDGSAVGRGTYPELFAAIGTAFGSGDDSTTFNLPDLIGKFIEGGNVAGTEKSAGLPNIEGTTSNVGVFGNGSGAFTGTTASPTLVIDTAGSAFGTDYIKFSASNSNAIYGNSDTVQPPSLTALPCIKAFSSVVSDGTVVIGNLASEVQAKNGEWAGHNAMPSGQVIDLSVPAADTAVIAPADGYYGIQATTNSSSYAYVALYHLGSVGYKCICKETDSSIYTSLPVSAGDIVYVSYMRVTNINFRFIYANGSAPSNS